MGQDDDDEREDIYSYELIYDMLNDHKYEINEISVHQEKDESWIQRAFWI